MVPHSKPPPGVVHNNPPPGVIVHRDPPPPGINFQKFTPVPPSQPPPPLDLETPESPRAAAPLIHSSPKERNVQNLISHHLWHRALFKTTAVHALIGKSEGKELNRSFSIPHNVSAELELERKTEREEHMDNLFETAQRLSASNLSISSPEKYPDTTAIENKMKAIFKTIMKTDDLSQLMTKSDVKLFAKNDGK
eukprot:g4127.t1